MRVRYPYIYDVFSLLLYFAAFIFVDILSKPRSIALLGYIITQYLVLFNRFWHNQLTLIFLFFSFTYIAYIQLYYYFEIPYHYLLETQSLINTNTVLILHTIFTTLIFLGQSEGFQNFRNIQSRKSPPIFFTNILILLIMLPISVVLSPPELGQNYSGEVQSSVWIEYCIVFMLVAGLYAFTPLEKKILFAVLMVYLLLPILYDRRLQFIMYVLVIFALYLNGRFSNRFIFLGLVGCFVLIRWYASVRMGSGLSVLASIGSVDDKGVMGNNQGGVFVASTVYIQLIKDGVFDAVFAVKSLFGVLLSFMLPASLNFTETYINLSALNYRALPGNGGFPGVYFYLWGGIFGCLLGGLLFRHLLFGTGGRLAIATSLLLFVTFPKWHSYSLLITVKLGVWLMIFMALFDSLYRLSQRGSRDAE